MNRRSLLAAGAALAAAGCATGRVGAAPDAAAFDAAFNYCYPLYEFARAQKRTTLGGEGTLPSADRLNRVFHRRGLTDHTARGGTSPNNDTLYSGAFLELSGGPVELSAPSVHDRYFSIAFMNAFLDNFQYIGTRATGGEGGRFWIVGPDFEGGAPPGVGLVKSDTNDVWMLCRTLVTGIGDLPAANAIQDLIALTLPEGRRPARPVTSATGEDANGEQVLTVANEILGRSRRQLGQAARTANFATLGVHAGTTAFDALPLAIQSGWRDAGPRGVARLRARYTAGGRVRDGWTGWLEGLGNFGTNDLDRAAIALGGIAALSHEEAMYFVSVSDGAGRPLDGAARYRMRIPAEGVPVDSFWSVTMYSAEPDGRYLFVESPINRYSIGDRSPGLVRSPDGVIDIIMSHDRPAPSLGGNWLPMPSGPFRVTLRAYLPKPEMLSGRWSPPPLERLD
jgi:hypothetical protein